MSASAAGQRRAKPAKEPTYEQIIEEALAEHERGNWTEARSLFERAHELQPSARTLRAMGLSAFEEKSYVTATALLSAALDDPRKPLTDDQRQQVSEVLRRARGFIAQYKLELTPNDAQVMVDGRAAVVVDGKLLLDPGARELVVTAEGHKESQRRIRAQPREDRVLRIVLSPLNAEAPDAVPAQPDLGAMEGPPSTEERGDGVSASGLSTQQYVGIGVAGLGVAGLATSLVFALRAKSKDDASGCIGRECPNETALELNQQARTAGTISTVAFVTGAAAMAAGAFLFFWSPGSGESETAVGVRVAPSVSPEFAGAILSSSW